MIASISRWLDGDIDNRSFLALLFVGLAAVGILIVKVQDLAAAEHIARIAG